jgi:hypothetical protein
LIICSFADSIRSARTADDSSTNADDYSVCPTCTKPHVSGSFHSSQVDSFFTPKTIPLAAKKFRRYSYFSLQKSPAFILVELSLCPKHSKQISIKAKVLPLESTNRIAFLGL